MPVKQEQKRKEKRRKRFSFVHDIGTDKMERDSNADWLFLLLLPDYY